MMDYINILLKGDVLHHGIGLTAFFKGYSKLVSEAYHSNLSSNEDHMPHDLQPGDYVHWKRQYLKDYLHPRCKVPYQVLLTNSCAAKLKGTDSRIQVSHLKRVPAPDWSIGGTDDLKLTLK